MEYNCCVLCTPSDFYLGDVLCRELEKDGKKCYFNLRDSKRNDGAPDKITSILSSISTVIAVVNEEFSTNSKYYMPVQFAISVKYNSIKTLILQSEPISRIPKEWFRTSIMDVSEGLTLEAIAETLGKDISSFKPAYKIQAPARAPEIAKPTATISTTPTQATDSAPQSDQAPTVKTPETLNLRVENVDLLSLIPTIENGSLTLQRAMRYLKGDGVPQDNERAISLFKKAATENPEDPATQFCLGICQELEGDEAGINEAYNAYKKALEADYSPALTRLAFISFRLNPKDNTEARELFTKALALNDPTGAYGLGLLAEAEKKYDDAVEYYSEAAELGNPQAQNALGCLYAEGKGITHSEEKAIQWFQLAAEQGLSQALFNCGIRLISTNVVENKQTGEKMLIEAANLGINSAKQALKKIEAEKLVEQRRKEAEQRKEEARNRNNRNNNGNEGNGWGEFFDALDLGGLASYAKDRLG